MTFIASVTSKRQLTLPVGIYDFLGLKPGSKLVIKLEGNSIRMESAEKLLHSLRGSIVLPKKYSGKSTEEIITDAKTHYFKEKYAK